jgi:hypothetical protein
MAKKTSTTSVPRKNTPKPTDAEQVALYMDALDYPLIEEVNALRTILKKSSTAITERIKWNAPSYYTTEDLVTFNLRLPDKVLLVFHHPAIVKITSALLEGDYKDRRLMYFAGMKEVKANKKELDRIMKEYIALASA